MILIVNAGSSSVKMALFDLLLRELLRGSVSEIGGEGRLRLGSRNEPASAPDHNMALALLVRGIEGQGHTLSDLSAAAHRVVHGGARLTAPCRVTPEAIASIEACVRLAHSTNRGTLPGSGRSRPSPLPSPSLRASIPPSTPTCPWSGKPMRSLRNSAMPDFVATDFTA